MLPTILLQSGGAGALVIGLLFCLLFPRSSAEDVASVDANQRVAPWIYPDTKGGGDYHVHAMSRDQARMGHDVTVLTTRICSLRAGKQMDTPCSGSSGVPLLGNDVSPDGGAVPLARDSDDFDVMHAHSHCTRTILAALKRRLGDIPRRSRITACTVRTRRSAVLAVPEDARAVDVQSG